MARREKKPVHKVVMTEGKRNIIQQLLQEDDYRNGYKSKRVNSSYGSMDIDVAQDRKSTFEPQIVKKHQKALFQTLQIKFCLRSKTGKIDRWMRYIRSSI